MPDSSEGEGEGGILDILESKEGSGRPPGGPLTGQLSKKSGFPRTGSALVFLLCSVTAWEQPGEGGLGAYAAMGFKRSSQDLG